MKAYLSQPWPKGQYKRYRAVKNCHRNASMLAGDHSDELILVKGYALAELGWVGHWWCVDQQGLVVDPSWKNEGVAYVGIEEVDLDDDAQRVLDSGMWELDVEQFASPQLASALERALAPR